MAIQWASAFEHALSWMELSESGDTWDTLDMKLATALNKILHGALKGKIDVIEHELANQKPPKVVKGRQIM